MELFIKSKAGINTSQALLKLQEYLGNSRVSYIYSIQQIKISVEPGYCSIPSVLQTIAEILEVSRIGV